MDEVYPNTCVLAATPYFENPVNSKHFEVNMIMLFVTVFVILIVISGIISLFVTLIIDKEAIEKWDYFSITGPGQQTKWGG